MPYDEFITFPDGSKAIVRFAGKRPPAHLCSVCLTRRASIQCDFPLLAGKTCDAHLCRSCAVSVGRNRDHCPHHG